MLGSRHLQMANTPLGVHGSGGVACLFRHHVHRMLTVIKRDDAFRQAWPEVDVHCNMLLST